MPYKTIAELPDNIKKLPEQKQKQWMSIFNSAYAQAIKDNKSEKDAELFAFANANGVVLKKAMEMNKIYIALKEDSSNDVLLLYPGKFKHDLYGNFEVTEKDLKHAIENFNKNIAVRFDENGSPELPANYQHASHDKNPDNAKASGWLKNIYLKGKELWAKVDWTEKAKEYIRGKEFKYISPEFSNNWTDENGQDCGFTVTGVALTNVPFLKKGQLAVSLNENSVLVLNEFEKNNTIVYKQSDAEPPASIKKDNKNLILDEVKMKELFEMFELTENDGDKVVEKVKNLMDSVKTLTKEKDALELKLQETDKKLKEADTNQTDSQKEIKALSESVTELQKSIAKSDAEKAIDFYLSEGKLLPKQKDFWIGRYIADKDGTVSYLNDTQPVMKMGEDGSANDSGKKHDDPTIELNEQVNELIKNGMSLKDAQNQILEDNPDLKKRYFAYQD